MWLERFVFGCHKTMGDVTFQARALTIHEALTVQAVLEQDWPSVPRCEAKRFLKSDLEGCLNYRAQPGSIQGRNRR